MFKRSLLSSSIAVATVLAGQSALAQDSDMTLEEVVVTGIRGSLTQALDIKRDSTQIVDAIVAEDIGKFPDNNVVEALQRVSGVQVTDRGAGEVTTVSIRGLDDVTTTVNGRTIFTSSGRSVALADIPASLLKRVDVYKTRSSDLIESGIAGQLDIHTHRPFDFDGSRVTLAARGIYQEQSEEIDPNVSALASNRWVTDAGEFGALVNISYAETSYRDQNVTAGAMFPFATENPPAGWAPYEMIRSFYDPNDPNYNKPINPPGAQLWTPGLEAGLPFAAGSTLDIPEISDEPVPYYLSRDALFQNDFTGTRKRPAANIALQWSPNDRSEYLFEAFYNGYRNESFNSLLFNFVDWQGPEGYDPNFVLYEGTNVVKERRIAAPFQFASGDLTTAETDSYVYALGGSWDISENLDVESELVYQRSEYQDEFLGMRTTRVAGEMNVDFNDGGIPAFNFVDGSGLTDPAQWNIGEFYDNAFRSEGEAVTFTVDASYQADWGLITNVDFGLRYDDRSAKEGDRLRELLPCGLDANGVLSCISSGPNDIEGLMRTNEGFFDGRSDVPTSWTVADGYYIHDNADELRSLYNEEANAGQPLSDELVILDDFTVDEATTAAYAQASFETDVGGNILDGQFGVRVVTIDTDITSWNDVREVSTGSASTTEVLPSLMVRYGITDDLLARVSYGETLRRPAFTQLNPNINYVPDNTDIGYGTATGGNPDLDPVHSKNYDLSLEWYFAESSSVFATIFRRDIEGLIVDFRNSVQYQAPEDDAPYTYILSQPDNASNGTLEGLELGLVYFPDNLPDLLDGIGVQASYTMLDSSQDIPVTNELGEVTGTDTTPMFGVSDSSASVVLAYEKEKFDARLSYVWRDDFLNNYEAALFANPLGVYREAETSVDFQLSYDVTDDFVVTFDATNLTDEIYQSYYEYPSTHNFSSSLYSRTFALGARYSF